MIHVDKANNHARREYLKSMLLKPDLHTDRYIIVLKKSIKVFVNNAYGSGCCLTLLRGIPEKLIHN